MFVSLERATNLVKQYVTVCNHQLTRCRKTKISKSFTVLSFRTALNIRTAMLVLLGAPLEDRISTCGHTTNSFLQMSLVRNPQQNTFFARDLISLSASPYTEAKTLKEGLLLQSSHQHSY